VNSIGAEVVLREGRDGTRLGSRTDHMRRAAEFARHDPQIWARPDEVGATSSFERFEGRDEIQKTLVAQLAVNCLQALGAFEIDVTNAVHEKRGFASGLP
jgi:hypothetical protein